MAFYNIAEFPEVDPEILNDCTTSVQCTFFETPHNSTPFTIQLCDNNVYLHVHSCLFYLHTLTPSSALRDVFDALDIEYYGIDVTSDALLNHAITFVLTTELQLQRSRNGLSHITMNIYSYNAVFHSMLHGGISTTLDSQTVDEQLLNDHISFEVATSLLNDVVFDTDMNDDEITISI
jgi:hypothetical protein